MAGLPATAGTPALRSFVSGGRCARGRRSCAMPARSILGKTNMHELAFGISGYNPAFNTSADPGVRNAYDVTRIAGGSSAGSGAAIGARMAPAALGTDTGGSVRIPCALNGCASLRPTVGRYPPGGDRADLAHPRHRRPDGRLHGRRGDLLDRVDHRRGAAIAPADLTRRARRRRERHSSANLDARYRAPSTPRLTRCKAAGVTVVDVDDAATGRAQRPGQLPGRAVRSVRRHGGLPARQQHRHQHRAAGRGRSPAPTSRARTTGLVIPRKLPDRPTAPSLTPRPSTTAAMPDRTGPRCMTLYATPSPRPSSTPSSSRPRRTRRDRWPTRGQQPRPTFMLFIQNTDPGSNAGVPGIQLPIGLGASSRCPSVSSSTGRPAATAADRHRHGDGEDVRTAAAAAALGRGSRR